jgi:hypothetical protein
VAEVGQGEAPGVERVFLAEGEEAFGEGPDGFGFGDGRFDPLVEDQADGQVGEQGVAVGLGAPEFDGFTLVTHGMFLSC